MPLYRKIFSRALAVSWQYKYLWFFGLFAAIIGSGGYEIVGQSLSSSPAFFEWINNLSQTGIFNSDIFGNLRKLAIEQPLNLSLMLLMYVFLAAAALFVLWLATVSQIAIVSNNLQILAGKAHTLQGGLSNGVKRFWPVFSMNVMEKIVVASVLFIVNLPLMFSAFTEISKAEMTAYIVIFIILVPALLIMSLIIKYAIAYIIIKNETFGQSLKRAWRLFADNWIISIEMALLLFFISFIFAFLVLISISVMVLPFLFLVNMTSIAFGAFASLIIVLISAIVALVFIVAASAFMTTFQIVCWTDLFIEIVGKGAESKLERIFSGLARKRA